MQWLNLKIVETGATAVYLPTALYRAVKRWYAGYREARRVLRPYAGHYVLFDVTSTPPCPHCGDSLLRVTEDWYECTRVRCTEVDTENYGGANVRVVYPAFSVPRIVRPKES